MTGRLRSRLGSALHDHALPVRFLILKEGDDKDKPGGPQGGEGDPTDDPPSALGNASGRFIEGLQEPGARLTQGQDHGGDAVGDGTEGAIPWLFGGFFQPLRQGS